MKLFLIGILALITTSLLTAALLTEYRAEQRVLMRFSGTGIAGKLDVVGAEPASLQIADDRDRETVVSVDAGGTFIARLAPGAYRLRPYGEARVVTLWVTAGDCLDVILDYRLPGLVLRIPGEGWPTPALA